MMCTQLMRHDADTRWILVDEYMVGFLVRALVKYISSFRVLVLN
jgi:hypothetical protein